MSPMPILYSGVLILESWAYVGQIRNIKVTKIEKIFSTCFSMFLLLLAWFIEIVWFAFSIPCLLAYLSLPS
jgi:hypothetical protein